MNRGRLLIFVSALVLVSVFVLLRLSSEVPGSSKKQEQGAGEWISPVEQQLVATGCRYPDETTLEARLGQITEEIDAWEERARLAPSEYLRSAVRLEQIIKCQGPGSEGRALAQAGKKRLLDQLKVRLRAAHALLHRGVKRGDREQASRAVALLDELLEEHGGSAKERLKRLRQRYD